MIKIQNQKYIHVHVDNTSDFECSKTVSFKLHVVCGRRRRIREDSSCRRSAGAFWKYFL